MTRSPRPRRIIAASFVAGMLVVLAAPVQGINIPEGGAVTPDSVFVIHFEVQEGCDGSPTDTLEVTIPESVANPVPEAVPGWEVETETVATEQEDGDADSRISLVRWTGGPLEDGQFLAFGLRAGFPDEPGATLEFPVVQRCGLLERAWTGSDDEMPAPTVVLAERFGPRDLIALSESLDELRAEVEEVRSQIGGVDATNLRSRLNDTESATKEIGGRLDELVQRVSDLEEASKG